MKGKLKRSIDANSHSFEPVGGQYYRFAPQRQRQQQDQYMRLMVMVVIMLIIIALIVMVVVVVEVIDTC
jgi:heme/copper-type cytochrome/quinol oxidase subunit 2